MWKNASVAIARKWLLKVGCALLACVTFGGGVHAAASRVEGQARASTPGCDQLKSEFNRLDRRLWQDKRGAKITGLEPGNSAETKSTAGPPASATRHELERPMGMAETMGELDRLSATYRAKRCNQQKSASPASAGGISVFAPAASVSNGQRDYKNRCAMCHGAAGNGNGWFSRYLKAPVLSLARLKVNAGGVFPFERLYDVIDGRQAVAVHGPREMPVWGDVYRATAGTAIEKSGEESVQTEGMVRARLYALLRYIEQLQE